MDCLDTQLKDVQKWNEEHPKDQKEEPLAITFGDVIKNEETGKFEPRDVHLTVVEDFFAMQRLDYIFLLDQGEKVLDEQDRSQINSVSSKTPILQDSSTKRTSNLRVVVEETKVEPHFTACNE